ncbi:solute carrier family 35 member SLC35F1/F2/F6 [Syncephalastrum racemosum]|uniref:Solute carrier family 35 member SLC35F1/F2/F6 n=1 Tax=Syncephalastrum racemosum TaxID=13706 RepID=A0A1X2H324_SYNRA|nr:solute carrier family 35 member SLC35F1/F2/F6 [Syncephalastrum racemosum]
MILSAFMKQYAQWVLPLCLGQALSLCITGTSTASSALWNHYSLNMPFTQNFLTYTLLFIVYGARKKDVSKGLIDKRTWPFLGFSFADVQANVLAVLAFKSTSVLSALIVSSWTLPCIMLLSIYCLGYRYHAPHYGGVGLSIVGLALLIWSDTIKDEASTANHSWIGDLICLTSATLYAVSNVTEEHLVNRCTTAEFLWRIGFWGSLLTGVQALFFERRVWFSMEPSWGAVGLISIYVLCLFSMYSLGPWLYRMSSATFLSMNLVTSNFYSLLIGLLFLDAKMPPFYPVAYVLVIAGVSLFNLTRPPSQSAEERLPIFQPLAQEDDQEQQNEADIWTESAAPSRH